jgi:two-component system chemotaxis response regulator CheB
MSDSKIKVLIVDDSVMIRKYLSRIIDETEEFELISTAPDGKIGLQKLLLYKPDLVILDIEMPNVNGLEFLKYVAKEVPQETKPHIIVFSSLVGDESSVTFEALALGASDFMKKPEGTISDNYELVKKELVFKIKELYKTKAQAASRSAAAGDTSGLTDRERDSIIANKILFGLTDYRTCDKLAAAKPKIVAVGSSTGGPNSIRRMLAKLGGLDIPMVIAQHMPEGFTLEFAKNLSNIYNRDVREAKDGDELKPGIIYICPGGCHSRVRRANMTLYYVSDIKSTKDFSSNRRSTSSSSRSAKPSGRTRCA